MKITRLSLFVILISVTLLLSRARTTLGYIADAAPPADYIAFYPFNGNANDESGNGFNGSVNGATLSENRFGTPDSAYHFDGNSDYIRVNDPVRYEPPYSVSFWFKYDGVQSKQQYIISNGGQTGVSQGLAFLIAGSTETHCGQLYPNGALYFGVRYEPTSFSGVQIAPVTSGEWHHVVGTWDGVSDAVNMKLYIDGVQSSVNQCSSTIPSGSYPPQPLTFGVPSNNLSSFELIGNIDDIRIYDRVLSQAEVQELNENVEILAEGAPLVDPFGVAISPTDGTIYVADYMANAIFAVPASGGTPSLIASGTSFTNVRHIAISPDGQTLYVAGWQRGEIVKVPTSGGTPTVLASGSPLVSPHGITVSPDGGTLYIVDDGAQKIFSLPATGGTLTTLASGSPLVRPTSIAVSSDDNTLFIANYNSSQSILRLPTSGGSPTTILTNHPTFSSLALSADNTTLFIIDAAGWSTPGASAMYQLPVSGGNPTQIFSGSPLFTVGQAALSSGGTALVSVDPGYVDRYGSGPAGEPGRVYKVSVDGGTPLILGKITSASSEIGLSGVIVTADIFSTTTALDGTYSMAVPAGTYTVKASPGTGNAYKSNESSGVVIEEGQTQTVNLKLTPIDNNSIDTLILANFQRMKDLGYAEADVDNLESKLNELKNASYDKSNMVATIVDLGSLGSPISDAYGNWNEHEGSVTYTNNLVTEIDNYIEDQKATAYPNLRYVILVGASEVIPMQARPDNSGRPPIIDIYTEKKWMEELRGSGGEFNYIDEIYTDSGSGNSRGYYLSDSIYRAIEGDEWVPELAVGRLVEVPNDISQVIDIYLQGNATIPVVDSGVMASEEFLGSGREVKSYLEKIAGGGGSVHASLDCNYSAFDIVNYLNPYHGITFIGGHGNYNNVSTGNEKFYAGDKGTNYAGTDDLGSINGAIVNMLSSCHAGLNIGNWKGKWPKIGTAEIDYHDFPEEFAQKGVVAYLGNTAYAHMSPTLLCLGPNWPDSPGYSERVAVDVFKHLTQGNGITIGEAFLKALQDFWKLSGNDPSKQEKHTMAISILYGIPNYRMPDTSSGSAQSLNVEQRSGIVVNDIQALDQQQIIIEIPSYQITPEGLVEISGATNVSFYNYPILPEILFERALPNGSTVANVTWNSAESGSQVLGNDIPIGSLGFSGGAVTGTFSYSSFYPHTVVQDFSISGLGGKSVAVGSKVTPVQYNPQTGQTRIWTKLVFDVEYNVASSNDTDGDGLPDYWEEAYGLDLLNDSGDNGSGADLDGDGLTNAQEFNYNTNPNLFDTDGDGVSDGLEKIYGTDPNNYFSKVYLTYLPTVLKIN